MRPMVFFEFTYKFPEEETHQLKAWSTLLSTDFNAIEWAKSNWLERRNYYYVQKVLGSGFFLIFYYFSLT